MYARLRRICGNFDRARKNGGAAVRLLWWEADRFTKRRLGLTILLILAGSLLAAMIPVIFKSALDHLPAEPTDFLPLGPLLMVLAYIGSQWLARCLNELRRLLHGKAEQRLIRRLSLRVFAHLLALPLRCHLDVKAGALSRTLANGILGYRILLEHAVFSFLPTAAQVAAMVIVLGHLYQPRGIAFEK